MMKRSINLERQTGSVLLEALVAVVIFSFGLLAMISMQSAAVRSTTDAKYRADASFLANQLVGQMWGTVAGNLSTFSNGVSSTSTNAATCPAGGSSASSTAAKSWLDEVGRVLPSADKNRQQISVDAATGRVTVRVCWRDRSSANAGDYHNHVVTAQINRNDL